MRRGCSRQHKRKSALVRPLAAGVASNKRRNAHIASAAVRGVAVCAPQRFFIPKNSHSSRRK